MKEYRVMSDGLEFRAVAVFCGMCLLAGVGIGAWGMHTWTQLQAEKNKPPVVQE